MSLEDHIRGLRHALLIAGAVLIIAVPFGVTHEWNPEHRALWNSNIQRVLSKSPTELRGPSKRHAISYVPGSKMPLYHYPDGTGTRRRPDNRDDRLQYFHAGAASEMVGRRVDENGLPIIKKPRKKKGRRMRHPKQHHQQQLENGSRGPPPPGSLVVRTVQRGSAIIPYPGASVTIRPQPAWSYQTVITGYPFTSDNPSFRNRTITGEIPPCPSDQTIIAPKGQDYVVMGAISVSDGSVLDVIAGPKPGDAASEGPHPIIGRLLAPETHDGQRQSRQCRFTYVVAVRRCGPPPAGGPGLSRPRCTAGSSWGSRCHYRCTQRGDQLRGRPWLECNNDLQWSDKAPRCASRRSCSIPSIPDHGVLSCRSKDLDHNDVHSLPEGSECVVSCNAPFAVKNTASDSVTILCDSGRWNSTDWECVLRVDAHMTDASFDGSIPTILSDGTAEETTSQDNHGDNYNNSVSIDTCLQNPCLSGGTCLKGPPNQPALCLCRPGTEGDRCERKLCRGPCLHGGRCVLVNSRPACFCRPGYAGGHCQATARRVGFLP